MMRFSAIGGTGIAPLNGREGEMSAIRYFVALMLVVTLPPLFFYWLLIHPFINFWRAKGIGFTYAVILAIVAAGLVGLFSIRHYLLAIDLGTHYLLVALGVLCLALSGTMRFALHKHLTIATLLGLPEIAPDRYPRTLVIEGMYACIRHPRYVQLMIALIGYALIANYLAAYFVVALWIPALCIIVLLEERELRDHFGTAYEDYCRRVPKFMPRLRDMRKQRSVADSLNPN
jgi:protein-S-isoprenylcysteine O-methyltransferase Ste14